MQRTEFCRLLDDLCEPPTPFRGWPEKALPVPEALERWLAGALQ
jgi:hypothetical protein